MLKNKLQASYGSDNNNWDAQFTHSGDISAFDKYKTLSKLHGLEDIDTIPLTQKVLVHNPVNLKNDIHNRKNAFQNIKDLFKLKKVCPCFD
jgi:hypothetical protein